MRLGGALPARPLARVLMLCGTCALAALPMLPTSPHAAADPGARYLDALERKDLNALAGLLAEGVDANLASPDGKTALMLAARQGRTDLVRRLLEAGADPDRSNRNGGTALMYAALAGDAAAVSLLLERGAHPDRAAVNGWTALMIAAAKGHTAVAADLLAGGADPNRTDVYGWTPLMRAAFEGRPGVVEVLAEAPGCEVEARDGNGATALHHAAAAGRTQSVRILLAHGADPRSRDAAGNTPTGMAQANGHEALMALLGGAR